MGSASAMGPGRDNLEAQKAQAVATYTYLVQYCSGGATYSMGLKKYDKNGSSTEQKIYQACLEVIGVKIASKSMTATTAINNRSVAQSLYYASSCGATATSRYVFSSSGLPYLVSVASTWETNEAIGRYGGGSNFQERTFTVKYDDLIAQLEKDLGGPLEFNGKLDPTGCPLTVDTYDGDGKPGNYVAYINATVKGTKVRGKAIRDAVNHMGGSMRSHAFTITGWDPATRTITMETVGWGHGVGMSQYGAIILANDEHWSYQQILKHYYSITSSSQFQLMACGS